MDFRVFLPGQHSSRGGKTVFSSSVKASDTSSVCQTRERADPDHVRLDSAPFLM